MRLFRTFFLGGTAEKGSGHLVAGHNSGNLRSKTFPIFLLCHVL
uniref:Uncharacterized protein n=1 Tax=Anguilla anguilla TaxID=7936 RepID=A0A0E9X9V5_ANGAN